MEKIVEFVVVGKIVLESKKYGKFEKWENLKV